MTPKDFLKNPYICPMPWTGLMYNFDGEVKNCIRSSGSVGNLKNQEIQGILRCAENQDTQFRMLNNMPGMKCYPCYDLQEGKKGFDIISDRVFYIKELKHVPLDTYKVGNHDLKSIDIRWTNTCNFACVYCGPRFSSKWASELGTEQSSPTQEQVIQFKNYILEHAENLKHVYLAGGEPLLMKENVELLELLKLKNPDVSLRINTNLSKVDTKVFDLVCDFKNVHWIISVESLHEQYEYIRFGGSWKDFEDNLSRLQKLDHKITFNMLYFVLNHLGLFRCIDHLREKGFHNNSFVIGPLLTPEYLNIKNLPDTIIQSIKQEITHRLDTRPGFLLEDGLENLLRYLQIPMIKNIKNTLQGIQTIDQRRGLDSTKIFKEFYEIAG